MQLIALTVSLIVFITAQAEDCLNYETPMHENLMFKDAQRECRRESEEENVDYTRCMHFKLRLLNRESKEPNFERYRDFTNKMVKNKDHKEMLLKAIEHCKEKEFFGHDKLEKFLRCWETKFAEVCREDEGYSYRRDE